MKTTATAHWNKGGVSEAHIMHEDWLVELENNKDFHIDNHNIYGDSFLDCVVDKNIKDVYIENVQDSIDIYNNAKTKNGNKKRADRLITVDSYMQSVEDDTRGKRQTKKINGKKVAKTDDELSRKKGKQLSYEMTFKVGNTERLKDDAGRTLYDSENHHIRTEELDRDLQRKVLHRFASEFEQQNPNMKIVKAFIHGDEGFFNNRGVWEHSPVELHVEMVPFASGFKQGLQVQNSMNKAMKEMGFDTPDCYQNFAEKQQNRLYEIAQDEYSKTHTDTLEFYQPVKNKSKPGDMSVENYKLQQQLNEMIDNVSVLQQDIILKRAEIADLKAKQDEENEKELQELKDAQNAEYASKLKELKDSYDILFNKLEKANTACEDVKNSYDVKVKKLEKEKADFQVLEDSQEAQNKALFLDLQNAVKEYKEVTKIYNNAIENFTKTDDTDFTKWLQKQQYFKPLQKCKNDISTNFVPTPYFVKDKSGNPVFTKTDVLQDYNVYKQAQMRNKQLNADERAKIRDLPDIAKFDDFEL